MSKIKNMSAVYDIEKIDFIRDHCTNDFNAMIYVESSFDLNVYLSGKDTVIVSMENKETQKMDRYLARVDRSNLSNSFVFILKNSNYKNLDKNIKQIVVL